MYHIAADSGCDLFELGGTSFSTVPLTIRTDRDEFVDDENLNTGEMIEHLLAYKGRSYTACPSTEAWLKAFVMKDGEIPDELYVVTLTSGLSGTFNSANTAKEIFLEDHPDTKVLMVDSLSVGPEMRLILEKIVELKETGFSFEEVSETIRKYSSSLRLFFAFKSLHNLAQNGRVNRLVASAAGVLGISVFGTASEEGQIRSLGKARGDRKVIASLLNEMENAGYQGGRVRISQTQNPELAEKIRDRILERYPLAEIQVYPVRGLCSYYCERGGICIGLETGDGV